LFFSAPPPTEIYTLSLHDALPIFEDLGHRLDARRLAVHDQLRALCLDAHLERLLEEAEVLVVRAKEGFRAPLGDRDTPHASINKDRKSTRLNSSHVAISYAVFCLK